MTGLENPWEGGVWLNPPLRAVAEGSDLVVEAIAGSDLWRTTSYGFVRDSGHALLFDFPDRTAVEVTFSVDFDQQFDQAGLLVRADQDNWVKTGVEVVDGTAHIGAVATRGVSDWSASPVGRWSGTRVVVRASRTDDALTLRARSANEPWQLVRLCPVPQGDQLSVGPYCCSPERGGLTVRFTSFRQTPGDARLHA